MTVDITGRHIEITEPIRKFAADRIERLRPMVDEVIEVHLILSVEKHQRHVAEVNVKTRHSFHNGTEESTDMYTSIAAVMDKVEKQILRSKDKKLSQKRHSEHLGVVASSQEDVESVVGHPLPKIIHTHDMAAKPLTIDDAVMQVGDGGSGFLVFRNAETQRLNVVYRRKDGNIGWIEPEA